MLAIFGSNSILIWVVITILSIVAVIVLGYFSIRLDWSISRRLNRNFTYEINHKKPLTKTIGKLVRKVKDDKSVQQAVTSMRNYRRLSFQENPNIVRYYLTFETKSGYKSFTVSKEVYAKYRIDTYGYIYHQKSNFDHFHVQSKSELGL